MHRGQDLLDNIGAADALLRAVRHVLQVHNCVLALGRTLDDHEAEIAAGMPLGRIGRPDDIGAAAIYLASPSAAWITGVLLPVDGGRSGTA